MGWPGKNSKVEVETKKSSPTTRKVGSGLKPGMMGFRKAVTKPAREKSREGKVNIVMMEGRDSLFSSAAPSLRHLGPTDKEGPDSDGPSHSATWGEAVRKVEMFEGEDKGSVQRST